ncbi:Predicted O-linked N-acetylglucosamine transferase, SPINDLY family [Anaerovibrio lipolyticus DSM 3074]|uniref:Predicted O-linked N-acetylglucosamine transferase, SPINDLY family n=1 Tax=Anaerovibrio lipolyticus DSM 3074 TaxID=1120997 RepID=A0A1M6EDQ2_9FIRM|nr:hypothetical protein [Anaerovibrio lipolyticus]SHI83605.1 Predicted O-linked N-acetylglucosamine transferase, SPINDLY family [Anaerovibrio lipolyticus DSM 3074]
MNIKQGQALKDSINALINAGNYEEACNQAQKLMREAEKKRWQELITFALSIQMAYVIENDNMSKAEKLAKKLAKQPTTGYGLFLQARLLLKQEKRREALEMGQKALAFANAHKDTSPREIFDKIYNLLGILYSNYGFHQQALDCDWQAMETAVTLDLKATNYSNYLFNLHFVHNSPEKYYAAHIGYNELFKDLTWFNHENKYQMEAIKRKPVGKIRIGYISPDLRYHVVLRFCWVMLAHYDKERFEVYCYHKNPNEDKYSEEIKDMTDNWRNISGMSADQAAKVIYDDKIDILVDLAGHTKDNPLPILAYKPAPIQVSGIGYFATTGLKAVDYFISDKYLASEPECFVEDIIALEHSHFCYAPLYEASETGKAPCLENGYITFGSFNAIRKINDEVLELWAEILKAVPDSHLLLKGTVFDDEYGYELFCQRLAKYGVDITSSEWQERIELRGFSQDYLREYLDMDIALDTFPYPGGGTTCDALYMGVPVITLSGNSHGERFGKSLLFNIGLSEFVVDSKQAYFDLAVALAGDKDIINNLHIGLRNMMEKSPLMDWALYMKELEATYKEIWSKYVDRLPAMEYPSAREALNHSFDSYKGKDYEKAEAWCRLAIGQDTEKKYLVEATSLLSDILQGKLDYVAAWQESKHALDMLEQEADKGTNEFQRRLWMHYASRSYDLGYMDEAVAGYDKAEQYVDNVYGKFGIKGSALMGILSRSDDCEVVRQRLTKIDELMEKVSAKCPDKVLKKDETEKIHLAYISPDFRQHVMFSFYYTMLHGYNHEKFRVTCISITEKCDGYTEHLKGLVDNWIDVSEMDWPEIIERLRKEKIDILVDLAGHSANSGIPVFCNRVAKIQISGLGWMESTGLSCVDYLITDKYIDPDLSNITEKPLYLTSQFCYTGRNDVRVPQGAPCMEKGYVTFGVFNNYHKITDEILLAWKEIMARVPNSRLLLKSQLLVSKSVCDVVWDRLHRLELDIERITLEPATNTYMNRYLDVDIALDTYPYPGGEPPVMHYIWGYQW